jgi:alkaline phosphatase D
MLTKGRYLSGVLHALLTLLLIASPAPDSVDTIAFGSCLRENRPAPIFDAINDVQPDVFVFLGDNVYADTDDAAEMQSHYDQLAAIPGFQRLRRQSMLLWTWDDHDFGKNDAGREWPFKHAAKRILLDFIDEPADSPRRERDGIYDSVTVGPEGERVQFLLLDTRWFRSPLKLKPDAPRKTYAPDTSRDATILGKEQWSWLEAELKKPADLRIVCTSIQVIAEEHRFEKWANIPNDRMRLLDLLADVEGGVMMISGDRHSGEISRIEHKDATLIDATSSALNQGRRGTNDEPNRHRVGRMHRQANFGTIDIDWPNQSLVVRLRNGEGEELEAVRYTW